METVKLSAEGFRIEIVCNPLFGGGDRRVEFSDRSASYFSSLSVSLADMPELFNPAEQLAFAIGRLVHVTDLQTGVPGAVWTPSMEDPVRLSRLIALGEAFGA